MITIEEVKHFKIGQRLFHFDGKTTCAVSGRPVYPDGKHFIFDAVIEGIKEHIQIADQNAHSWDMVPRR